MLLGVPRPTPTGATGAGPAESPGSLLGERDLPDARALWTRLGSGDDSDSWFFTTSWSLMGAATIAISTEAGDTENSKDVFPTVEVPFDGLEAILPQSYG